MTKKDTQDDKIEEELNEEEEITSNIKKLKSTNVASLVKKEKHQLTKFYKWTCGDDYLLKNAVQEGYDAEEIASIGNFNY
jgi:hypothetical protein